MSARTVALITAALAIALAGCASNSDTSVTTSQGDEMRPLAAARQECAPRSSHIDVLDDGATLSIDGEGEESVGADIMEIACILNELDMSDAVTARMDNTRALDGVQTGEWDGYTASWSYHPDDGIDLIIEES